MQFIYPLQLESVQTNMDKSSTAFQAPFLTAANPPAYVAPSAAWTCTDHQGSASKPKSSATIISQVGSSSTSAPVLFASLEPTRINPPPVGPVQPDDSSTLQVSQQQQENVRNSNKTKIFSLVQRRKVVKPGSVKKESLDVSESQPLKQTRRLEKHHRRVGFVKNQSNSIRVVASPYHHSGNQVKLPSKNSDDGGLNYLNPSHPGQNVPAYHQQYGKSTSQLDGELASYYNSVDIGKSDRILFDAGETGPASERLRQMAARYQNHQSQAYYPTDYCGVNGPTEPVYEMNCFTSTGIVEQRKELCDTASSNSFNPISSSDMFQTNSGVNQKQISTPAVVETFSKGSVVSKEQQNSASSLAGSNPVNFKTPNPVHSTFYDTKVPAANHNFHPTSFYYHPTQPPQTRLAPSGGSYQIQKEDACSEESNPYLMRSTYADNTISSNLGSCCTPSLSDSNNNNNNNNNNQSNSDGNNCSSGSSNGDNSCYESFTDDQSLKHSQDIYQAWNPSDVYYQYGLNQTWSDANHYGKIPGDKGLSQPTKQDQVLDIGAYNMQTFSTLEYPPISRSLFHLPPPPPLPISTVNPIATPQNTINQMAFQEKKFQLSHFGEVSGAVLERSTNSCSVDTTRSQNNTPWPFSTHQLDGGYWRQQADYSLTAARSDGFSSDDFPARTLLQSERVVLTSKEPCIKNSIAESKPPPPPYLSPKSKRKVCAVVNPSVVTKPDSRNEANFCGNKNDVNPVKLTPAADPGEKHIRVEPYELQLHQRQQKYQASEAAVVVGGGSNFDPVGFQDSFGSSSCYQHKLSIV